MHPGQSVSLPSLPPFLLSSSSAASQPMLSTVDGCHVCVCGRGEGTFVDSTM